MSEVKEAHAAIAPLQECYDKALKRALGAFLVSLGIVVGLVFVAPRWIAILVTAWAVYVVLREAWRADRASNLLDQAIERRNVLLVIQEHEAGIAAADALIRHLDRGGSPDDPYAQLMCAEMNRPNGYYTRKWEGEA